MSVLKILKDVTIPGLEHLLKTIDQKIVEFDGIVKMSRTHLQDAVPIKLSQEFSAFSTMIKNSIRRLLQCVPSLTELALGGTACGTGLNTTEGYDVAIAELLGKEVGLDTGIWKLKTAPNKFEALSTVDSLVELNGALNSTALSINKIANDIRLLGCGPRGGIGELILPANEPGSSIMPGKINPTQCESLTMIVAKVMGNCNTINWCGGNGQLQLNVMRPVLASSMIESLELIGEGCVNFSDRCLLGLTANKPKIDEILNNSLMNVTALNPHIGYEKAAAIAKDGHKRGVSLKRAAVDSGFVTEEQFGEWVNLEAMCGPKKRKSDA